MKIFKELFNKLRKNIILIDGFEYIHSRKTTHFPHNEWKVVINDVRYYDVKIIELLDEWKYYWSEGCGDSGYKLRGSLITKINKHREYKKMKIRNEKINKIKSKIDF